MRLRDKSKEFEPVPLYIEAPLPSVPLPAQVQKDEVQRGVFEIDMTGNESKE